MKNNKIKLSILVGVSMLLLMPNVASAQNNSAGESVSSQSSIIDLNCGPLRCDW